MIEKTKAIVLHTVRCTGSSVIVHCYTELFGKVSFVVNNTHGKRSQMKNAMLQPLSLLEIDMDFVRSKELQHVNDCKTDYAFKLIPYEMSRNALAIFVAEVLYRSLREPLKDKRLFAFIWQTVVTLDKAKSLGYFHIAFLVQYVKHNGFELHSENYEKGYLFDMQNGIFISPTSNHNLCLEGNESWLLSQLCEIDYGNMGEAHLSKKDKEMMLLKLLEYCKLHFSNFKGIKSLDIIYQLFD